MSNEEHRVEFHQSLDDVRTDVVRLGAMTTEVVAKGTASLLERDLRSAQQVIDGDEQINALALDIEERCYQVLALQNPMARDLRMIICAIRMASELERSADLMVNICKAARRLYDVRIPPTIRGLIEDMSLEAGGLTRKAIEAFSEQDVGMASALDDIDDRLDDLHVEYIESIFGDMGDSTLSSAVQLALIGRFYERIGDHAVTMGERITYMVTGWLPESDEVAELKSGLDSRGD